jgi:DNA-binding response OmpR family regulator
MKDEPEEGVRLLVVDDEQHLLAGLRLNFELEGYTVDTAATAREAAALLAGRKPYSAIVLDVTLPDTDGFELCRRMRQAGNLTPVIMLTARNLARDRVTGLEVGADDYLTKPFDLDELLARVRSLLRRQRWEARRVGASPGSALRFGRATVDFDSHEVEVGGEELKLTALELDLLRYFAQNAERVLSREELLTQVWKLRDYPNTRTVDNFVLRLRKHFEPDPADPVHFLSIRGAGYKFVPGDG